MTLLLVPVSLKCLTTGEYGIWLTLTSIIAWFISLDFGLGNGLRNKLAEALAVNDLKLAKIYTSTTYAYLTIFVAFFYIIFLKNITNRVICLYLIEIAGLNETRWKGYGAGEGIRTLDPNLGKVVLYH